MARTVKCPKCSAELTVKDGNRDFMFCEYCGTKVSLDDYQETHRYVDEAAIKKTEAEREIELKKIELEKQKLEIKQKDDRMGLIVSGTMFIGAIIMLLLMKWGLI